mgnify:FL=1|tara:strand:+ start:6431 stop:7426 length:996 start_codon:yes stop_codon:yes gene_type:complete
MSDSISYQDDFAPMEGKHFGRPISDANSAYLYETYGAPRMQILADRRKDRIQQLAFEKAQLDLQRIKEENQRKNIEAEIIAEESSALTEIRNNPELDSFEKVQAINVRRQNVFSRNPLMAGSALLKTVFDTAASTSSALKAKEEAQARNITALASIGDVDRATALANEDGRITDTERGLLEVAKSTDEDNKAKARASGLSERRSDLSKQLQKDIDTISRFVGYDKGSGIDMPTDQVEDARVRGGGGEFRLDKDQNERMRGIAQRQLSPKEFEAYVDLESKEYEDGGFYDDASRKSYLLNKLNGIVFSFLNDLNTAGGSADTSAGKDAYTKE